MNFSEFQVEVAFGSRLLLIKASLYEEFLFGFLPLLVSFIFPFQFYHIYLTQIVSRFLWATAHNGEQKNWQILYPIGLWYAVCWSIFPLFAVALVFHPGSNLLVQMRMRHLILSEMHREFDRHNIV